MRANGMRQVQISVRDVRSEEFAAQAQRQARAVAAADRRGDGQDFIEAIYSPWEE